MSFIGFCPLHGPSLYFLNYPDLVEILIHCLSNSFSLKHVNYRFHGRDLIYSFSHQKAIEKEVMLFNSIAITFFFRQNPADYKITIFHFGYPGDQT